VSGRFLLPAALGAIAIALAVLPSAPATVRDTLLPRQGGTTSEQVIATRQCAGDDEYLSGMRGSTSWDLLRFPIGGINGVRTLGISCREMLDLGEATAPIEERDEAGYPPEAFLNDNPPTYHEECGLRNADGQIVEAGVAKGFFGWIEPGEKGFIRELGLSCMTLAGGFLGGIGTPVSLADPAPTPDFAIDCPAGQAAVGIRVGLSELKAPFDPRDLMSAQLICRTYLRPPDFVSIVGPTGGALVDQRSGARFRWKAAAGAVRYQVCALALGGECATTDATSIPVDDLVHSASVGRRFAWSIRGCALAPKLHSTMPRICGPTTTEPTGGRSDPFAIRFAPRQVTSARATPAALTFSDAAPVQIAVRFQGQPLAKRYLVAIAGRPDVQPKSAVEGSPAGSAQAVALAVPVRGQAPALGPPGVVLRPTVQSCAGDPPREICGTPVPTTAIVADRRTHRVCLLARQKSAKPDCAVPRAPKGARRREAQ
jgi:hypothetical protein